MENEKGEYKDCGFCRFDGFGSDAAAKYGRRIFCKCSGNTRYIFCFFAFLCLQREKDNESNCRGGFVRNIIRFVLAYKVFVVYADIFVRRGFDVLSEKLLPAPEYILCECDSIRYIYCRRVCNVPDYI